MKAVTCAVFVPCSVTLEVSCVSCAQPSFPPSFIVPHCLNSRREARVRVRVRVGEVFLLH